MNWTHDTRRTPVARFRYDGEAVLAFPYNKRLVDRLKAEIPGHARTYDPAVKTWTVARSHAAIAVSLLRATFPDATIEDLGHRPAPQPIRSSDQSYAVLHLLPTAPPELVDGAHRILAKLSHPDAGGSNEAMRMLNEARDALKDVVAL